MIRLGIIGMSEGNAHPYSWSAIINGQFDGSEIIKVGYPAVAAYLEANRDTLGVSGARVTHVWTQDPAVSKSIADATGIEHIADALTDMIGNVDAVLLTRDDPENHVSMATPFLTAGVPLFIDKPLAATSEDLSFFASEAAKGRFFMSCSSMRYANECRVLKQELPNLGPLQLITGVGKKDWIKYGVHMLEAIASVNDDVQPVAVTNAGKPEKDIVTIEYANGVIATLHLFMDIAPTFQLSVFGKNAWRMADIRNSYSMFRDNIIAFVRSVEEGQPRVPFFVTKKIIDVLIAAAESRKRNGERISLI